MAGSQDLRKRIRTVQNTQQITKAMKMVASARLSKAQQKAHKTTPYAEALKAMMHHLLGNKTEFAGPLTEVRPVKNVGYIIVGADKGLAGAFNTNVFKKAHSLVEETGKDACRIITCGRKPLEMLSSRNINPVSSHIGESDKPSYELAEEVAKEASTMFLNGEVDEVHVVYTHFINSLTYDVRVKKILPVSLDAEEAETTEYTQEYEFVPTKETVLSLLLPKVLNFDIYSALIQSAASELGSRMTAMTTASDNAGSLIESLNLEYNRMRQAQITNEISEIIGGANALQ